jgi:uncharacterized protein (TIGR02246 family)
MLKQTAFTWRRACLSLATAPCLFTGVIAYGDDKAPQPATAVSADESTIRSGTKEYEKAFNAGDAKALAAMFAPDAELVDERGKTFKGREQIEGEFAAIFAQQPGAKLQIHCDAVKFLSPEVAIETGTASGETKDGTTSAGTKYSSILVKVDGKWLISNVNEARASTLVGDERLAKLKFLVGNWKADLGEGKTYKSSCQWMPGENFLSRNFSVQQNGQTLSSGTQIIGFDPVVGQIVSWTFDSSGGFGHEIWEETSGRWRIAASSVLPDGATSLATNYLTKLNGNTFTWESNERSLNDQLLPDTAVVRVERDMQ